ncbi:spore gernimation protein [Paenibacillus sp. CAA11]|uniref:GerAB/ArcD/ProY family transporter n=1 Tax=Paenibacillus sp. CAA11 TaxID=1532905 RepID=UPI000D333933|nr:endospore germination permease [Paenibacillus sp. CAA11]AWB46477.1 spore gernimation protein [Paenibacillus sp. CAA11]
MGEGAEVMLEKEKISARQLATLIFLCGMGDMFQLFPGAITPIAHQDSWIASLISIPCGVLTVWILLQVHAAHPELSLIGLSKHILGRWLGGVVSLWYLFYFLMVSSYLLREMGDFLTTQIFLKTPLQVIHLLFILLIVGALIAGLEAVGRSSEIILPIFLLFVLILMVCLLPKLEFKHLRPMGENPLGSIIQGSLLASMYPFAQMSAFLMVLPNVNWKSKYKRDTLLAAACVGSLLFCLLVISLLVMGTQMTEVSVYPTYVLSQIINIGNFVQRIEAIMAIAYLTASYLKSVIFCYAFVKGAAELCGLDQYRKLVLPAGMLVFGMAVLIAPDVIYYLKTIVMPWAYWDLTNGVLLPLLLLGAYAVRKRWRKRQA